MWARSTLFHGGPPIPDALSHPYYI
jgi:hypothetical protein